MRMRKMMVTIAILAAAATAFAGAGGAQFLKYGGGARAQGMAEAYVAVKGDSVGMSYNPGSLGALKEIDVELLGYLLYEGMIYGNLAGSYPLSFGTVGLNVVYNSIESFMHVDGDGNEDTSLSLGGSNIAVAAGLGVNAP